MCPVSDWTVWLRNFILCCSNSEPSRRSEKPMRVTPTSALDDLLTGRYKPVQRIVAFITVEDCSRDASEDVADALKNHIAAERRKVSEGFRDFTEGQLGRRADKQL